MNGPLISIIIPVYNTEKYLKRCLESVLEQTYSNLQVIVVNDHSPGDVIKIVDSFKEVDDRVELVDNKKNLGLFHTRLNGANKAKGEYIYFIDSDDYMGIDFIRTLMKKAIEKKADIVKAGFVIDYENKKTIYPYINNIPEGELYGDDILNNYFAQQGLNFSWHTIWNKLYSKELWDKCIPYYQEIETHLIMTEDFAFSTVLFALAKHYVEIEESTYFYVKREDASTSLEACIKKFRKNISDMGISFKFVINFLKKINKYEQVKDGYIKWKELYGKIWKENITNSALNSIQKKDLYRLLKETLEVEEVSFLTEDDKYFYSLEINWDDRLENSKLKIANDYVEYVSFDVFDTLIVRPFFEPSDLFYLLDKKYKKEFPKSNLEFDKIRKEIEVKVRKKISKKYEEVTLDEIYDEIEKEYFISKEILDKLEEEEKKLEIRFCYSRKIGKDLFELAKDLNKKILITSDMYLSKNVIQKILKKNKYTGYLEIFVSSDLRITKSKGSLYKYIMQKYMIKGRKIVHVGDNYQSDVEMAYKNGLDSIYLPKSTDLIRDYNKYGKSFKFINDESKGLFINSTAMEFFGIKCAIGIVANKYFDNPFISFSSESDFNSDVYHMGYYALGMHLLGVSLDLIKKSLNKKKIHFAARDGFICKKVYDEIGKEISGIPESNYLYMSRKALIPTSIKSESEFYTILNYMSGNNIITQTPRSILEKFLHININNKVIEFVEKNDFNMSKEFNSKSNLLLFLKLMSDNKEINKQLFEYKKMVKEYFENIIDSDDVIFDIGYNGTAQKLVSTLIDKKIDAYYVYINKDKALRYSNEMKYNIETFYDYTPKVTGPVREFFMSENSPSCVGYRKENEILPIFESVKEGYIQKYIQDRICQGSVDFASDYLKKFAENIEEMTYRSYEISLPFEYLMGKSSEIDKRAFKACYFEDDVFLGKGKISVYDFWKKTSRSDKEEGNELINFYQEKRWKQNVYLLLFNKHAIAEKIYLKLLNRPILFQP